MHFNDKYNDSDIPNSILKEAQGIVVKSHQTRSQAQNLQMAKERLVTRLDNLWNGEKSIQSQINEIEKKRSIKADQRRKKLKEVKDQWKEREGIT